MSYNSYCYIPRGTYESCLWNWCGKNTYSVWVGVTVSSTWNAWLGKDITGTKGNDTINGTCTVDHIFAGSGNDTIYAGWGSDVIDGGKGADVMNGGLGNDTYYVDNVNDKVVENCGILGGCDTVYTTVDYTLSTNVENLTALGHDNLTLNGNNQNNVIIGNDGDNTINGGAGCDTIHGGAGNDTLNGDAGNDTIYGGEGCDTINGGDGCDTLYGGADNDILDGGAGNDVLHGGNGDDILIGGGGRDALYGDAGNDNLYGSNDSDYLYGGTGNDVIDGGYGNDYLNGGSGDDFYVYGPEYGRDKIVDCSGNDTVEFKEGFHLANMTFSECGNDLVITFANDSKDSLTIDNWFCGTNNQIETFAFDCECPTVSNSVINEAFANSCGAAVNGSTLQAMVEQQASQAQHTMLC